jgi:hypothetical protein
VPILNTKEPIIINSVYNCIETYNSICPEYSTANLADNFPALAQNIDTVNHLANYLQKTSFFRNLQPYVNQKSLEYIIEILHNQQIFYKKVTLSIAAIAEIVCRAINTQYLRNLTTTYPQYQFALITQYIFSLISSNYFQDLSALIQEFKILIKYGKKKPAKISSVWHLS